MISPRIFSLVAPLVGVLTWGCELEGKLSELAKELGNPDKDNFDVPGRLLLEGGYAYPAIEGNSSSGAFITALRSDNHMTITSYDTLESCSVGPIRAYRSPPRRDTDNMSATARDLLMPVVLAATDDQPERLVFSDLECKLSDITLEGGSLPLNDTFAAGGGSIAQDAEGGVWYVDPRKDEKKRIASDTIAVTSDSHALFADGTEGARWMFTVEGGEVVARGEDLKEAFRAAESVEGLIYHKDARGSIVLLVRTAGSTWTSLPLEAPDEPTTIAMNACSPKVYDSETARQFLWIDCETLDLMLYDFGEGEASRLAKGVRNYRVLDQTKTGPLLLYTEQEGSLDGDTGPLHAKWGSEDAVFLGNDGNLRMSWVDLKGTQRPIVDWDPATKSGTLKYAAPGEALETLAKSVAYVSSLGVISNFDGNNGKFSRLSGNELTLVHEHVHPRGLRLDPDRDRDRLLISTNQSEKGAELTLVSGETDVKKLTDDVLVDSYAFSLNANLVSALTDVDPEDERIGTLRMLRVDRPVSQTISKGVLHALETTWPDPGILYVAPKAKEPGLYFAEATQ